MNISPVNLQYHQRRYQPAFQSTFPVVHWVAESNGSYAPALGLDMVRKLQRKLISVLNKSDNDLKLTQAEKNVKKYVQLCDKDFRRYSKVRSFYDRVENDNINGYKHNAFAITGIDIDDFEKSLAKKIGKAKGHALRKLGTTRSAEAQLAIQDYLTNGLDFVSKPDKRIYDIDGVPCVLHTKFEVVRNKAGKTKGFNFVDARFLPEYGAKNPFERIKNG